MQNREQAHQRSADINDGLHHVGPDHRRQSAFKGIDQRQSGDDCDGRDLSRPQRDRNHDGNGINSHAFSCGAGHQEEAGSQRPQLLAKAPFDQFVRGIQIAAKIVRQQNKTDDHASHDVSHHHLQKRQIGVVSQTWNADDGERAGFRRDDGKRNRPPGNIPVGEKIIAQRALLLAKAQSEQSDPRQVQRDDGEIKLVQSP